MHKLHTFFLGSLLLAYPALLLAGWQWQNPLPQGNALRDVAFVNASEGFAVGACGTILHTTDGGLNWQNMVSPSTALLCRITALDAEHVWVVGIDGTILFGGANTPWELQTSGTLRELRGVSFVNPLRGWVVGGVGTVLMTTDGGETWSGDDSVQVGSYPMAEDLLGVHFVDDSTGWAVGGYSYNDRAVVLKTTDGGLTWSSHNYSINGWLADVYFTDATHGWAVGREDFSSALILRTTNGTTWSTPAQGVPSQPLRAVFFADTSHGWAIGHAGVFIHTNDGGLHWSGSSLDTTLRLDGLSVADGTLLAVGDGGAIFQAAHADSEWARQDHGGRYALSSIAFATPEVGYAVAANGCALRTTNGGAVWLPDLSDSGHAMAAVCFIDALSGWKIGYNARFEKTTDGGATWSVVHEEGGIFNDVQFVNDRHGWVVGNNGEMLYTRDGGDSWGQYTDGEYTFLSAVWMLDSSRAFVAGGGGAIFYTADGGNIWQPQLSGTNEPLRDITFVTDALGWAVGDNGTIVHTTNGGETWAEQSSGTEASLRAVAFADAELGWTAGANGTLLHTWNGGATWVPDTSRASANFTGLARAANGRVWVCGGDGTILSLRDFESIDALPDPFIFHPSSFTLAAYPNPFNPSTALAFTLSVAGHVTLAVYDLTGRRITTLADNVLTAGQHVVSLDASDWPSGLYFARLSGPSSSVTHKLVLLK